MCYSSLVSTPGRSTGTTRSEGYDVGTSGDRPTGSIASERYAVSGGRPILVQQPVKGMLSLGVDLLVLGSWLPSWMI